MTHDNPVPHMSEPGREPIARIPCYEGPESRGLPSTLDLSADDLTRHILVLGSTGAGKTTLLRNIMRQLIAHRASDPDRKLALLIFDFKGDDSAQFILSQAKGVGREADCRILSLGSSCAYPFFSGMHELGDATEYAERLLFACGATTVGDKFWDEFRLGMFTSALAWLRLTAPTTDFTDWVSDCASWMLAERMPPHLRKRLEYFRRAVEALPLKSSERAIGAYALGTIDDWENSIDPRTKSNVKATINNALRPLLNPNVQRLFRGDAAEYVNIGEALERGHIIVVSINAFQDPNLASLLSKTIKAEFYKSVFKRSSHSGSNHRLAMLVADEYHIAATVGGARYDDAAALCLLRGFGAGMIASTQTVANIDRSIGIANRHVLLPNFGTLAFLRTTEVETAAFATQICGTKIEDEVVREQRRRPSPSGYVEITNRITTRKVERPVCSQGALANLEPGQAFLHRQFDVTPKWPVWISNEI